MTCGLIGIDTVSIENNTPNANGGLILETFKPILLKTHNVVDAMLSDIKLTENSCRIEPYTDSYTYTFAYLSLWDIVLTLCRDSSTELCYQYTVRLRDEDDLLIKMLNNIFKLMPIDVLNNDTITRQQQQHQQQHCRYDDYFAKRYTLDLLNERVTNDGQRIEEIACWIYSTTVQCLPACVRQWWSNSDARMSQLIERVTTRHVSPRLLSQELHDIAKHSNKFKNMTVSDFYSIRSFLTATIVYINS